MTTETQDKLRDASRRTVLMASAGGVALATAASAVGAGMAHAQSGPRKTFVLIHGSWHGGWCWRPVVNILEGNGHKVYAPSLAGLADRSHLLAPTVNLDTHITDIVNLFKWEDIENACLVGHSYAGWPLSGAAEKLEGKITSIVFVDAFLPENGQRHVDLTSEAQRKTMLEAVERKEAGRPVPKAEAFKIIDPKNTAWVQSKMTPHPTATAASVAALTGARDRIPRKTYIRATGYPQANFDRYYAACKADNSWKTFEFAPSESGHDVMVDAPQRLAEILLQVA